MDKETEEQVGPADRAKLQSLWQLLKRYDAKARDPGIDQLLTMYRRAFDRRFLPIAARAGLMFSTMEGILGPFRKRDEPIQLHYLATALAGKNLPEATEWFEREGRDYRNSVAHGFWNPSEEQANQPLDYLTSLLSVLLVQFLRHWTELGDHNHQHPGLSFIEYATRVAKGAEPPPSITIAPIS